MQSDRVVTQPPWPVRVVEAAMRALPASWLAKDARAEPVLEARRHRLGPVSLDVTGRPFRVEGDGSQLEAFTECGQQLLETLDGRDLVAALDPADRGLPGAGAHRGATRR